MSKIGKSRSSSRSSQSRSRSGSLSLSRSRSRSRSHSKKHKHSSRSRSKSRSPQLHNRERQYPRAYQNPNQNRDFRGQNRGYRRPFYFRQRGRGFYQRGQYNNNRGGYGNYRQNWQNYRPNYSPRRNRSRSRSPKQRSASPQSRSRSRNSYRSSSDRSERSSSSRSSSPRSKSPPAKRKSLKSKKATKEAKLFAQEQQEADSKERKSTDTADRSIKPSEGSSGTVQGASAALDASQTGSAATSASSPSRKSPLHSVVVKRSPALAVPAQKPSPHYSPPRPHAVQQSTGMPSVLHRSASRQSSSPVKKSPPVNNSSQKEDNRAGEISPPAATFIRRYLEEQKSKASGLERENGREREQKAVDLEKERIKEKSSTSEMSAVKSEYYSIPNEMERLYRGSQSPKKKKHSEEYEKCVAAAEFYKDSRYDQEAADELEKSSSGLLVHERRISQELVHCSKKEQGFKSIFQHLQSLQSRRSPSELFAQHIVTIVHYVKEHHFESSGMTLSERFSLYQRRAAEQEMAKHKKSPEIHRRIDISPSAFRKLPFRLDEKKKSRENSHKGDVKYQEDPVDLRLDIEQRKKYKEKHPKRIGPRESIESDDSSQSRDRSVEKTEKHLKGSKKHKKQKKMRARSRSSSSSSHTFHSDGSAEYHEELEDRDDEMHIFDKSRLGPRDYGGPTEREQGRGAFQQQQRMRGRGWNKSTFVGSSNSDFQKRTWEEEWDPEYTPKSKKYYLHDDREGEEEEKWIARGRGRSSFMRGRGRFIYKKTSTSPKWTHDKYQGSGEEGELEDDDDSEGEDKDEKKISNME